MKRTLILTAILTLLAAPAWAASKGGTLEKIKTSGTFTIGFRADSPPFSSQDENGNPAGYSIELCRRIAAAVKEHLGRSDLEVKYETVTAEDRFDAVVDGRVDIMCGSTTKTLSRQERVDFTQLIFVTGGSLLTTKDSGVRSTSDLAGKSVAVMKDTTTETALQEFLSDGLIDAEVRKVDTHQEGMRLVEGGEVAAFASDRVVLFGLGTQASDPSKLALSEDIFSYEPYALMVRKNDSDFRLLANRALARIYRSGQIGDIYKKSFGAAGARPSDLLLAMFRLEAVPE